jgi:hypothetical protein
LLGAVVHLVPSMMPLAAAVPSEPSCCGPCARRRADAAGGASHEEVGG